MPYEVEQKYRVGDLATVEAKLVTLGGRPGAPVKQRDTYFGHPVRDFARTDEALRIRRVGSTSSVTYKGPKLDTATKTRRELEFPLVPGRDGAERFAELLEALGFSPRAEVRKTRTPVQIAWQGWSVEAALDQVDELGSFVELELSVDQVQLAAAAEAIGSLAAALGLIRTERRSYLELLLER